MWPKHNKCASIGAWKRGRTRKSNIASLCFLCWVLIHLTIRESPPTFICISFYFHIISKSLRTSSVKAKLRMIWSGSNAAVLGISRQINFNLLCYIIPPTNLKLAIFIPRVQGDNVIFFGEFEYFLSVFYFGNLRRSSDCGMTTRGFFAIAYIFLGRKNSSNLISFDGLGLDSKFLFLLHSFLSAFSQGRFALSSVMLIISPHLMAYFGGWGGQGGSSFSYIYIIRFQKLHF